MITNWTELSSEFMVCVTSWRFLPMYSPVTGLWGFPITCPMHSFIRACKFCRKTNNIISKKITRHGHSQGNLWMMRRWEMIFFFFLPESRLLAKPIWRQVQSPGENRNPESPTCLCETLDVNQCIPTLSVCLFHPPSVVFLIYVSVLTNLILS